MKRGLIVLMIAVGVLTLGVGPAGALDCSSFSRVQTYGSWGPAAHYGETVTVDFSADACSGGMSEGSFGYTLSGTASVYAGDEATGTPIAVEPFVTFGSFSDPDEEGWPPRWWSCTSSADITWKIPGVYTFVASASDGHWNLQVRAAGTPEVRWTHAAC